MDAERGRIALKLVSPSREDGAEVTPEVLGGPLQGSSSRTPARAAAGASGDGGGDRGGYREHRAGIARGSLSSDAACRGCSRAAGSRPQCRPCGRRGGPAARTAARPAERSWQAWRAVGERLAPALPGDRRRPARLRALARARGRALPAAGGGRASGRGARRARGRRATSSPATRWAAASRSCYALAASRRTCRRSPCSRRPG